MGHSKIPLKTPFNNKKKTFFKTTRFRSIYLLRFDCLLIRVTANYDYLFFIKVYKIYFIYS